MSQVLTDSLTHKNAKCENLSLVFHLMTFFFKTKAFVFKTPCWKILQRSFDLSKSPCVYAFMGHGFFGFSPQDAAAFLILSRTYIAENLCKPRIKFESFTLRGGGGGDLPHLAPPNTCIYIFFPCYAIVNLNFGRCPISEFTTHSQRMVNIHYHAQTPDPT